MSYFTLVVRVLIFKKKKNLNFSEYKNPQYKYWLNYESFVPMRTIVTR